MAQPQDHLSPWPPCIRQPSHIPTFNSSPVTSPQVPEQRHRSQKAKEVVVARPAESEEELKSIMASGPITSWEVDGETVADFIFWPFLLFSGWSPGAQDAAGQAPGCAWDPVVGLENHLSTFPERELVRAASYTEALIRTLPIPFS